MGHRRGGLASSRAPAVLVLPTEYITILYTTKMCMHNVLLLAIYNKYVCSIIPWGGEVLLQKSRDPGILSGHLLNTPRATGLPG